MKKIEIARAIKKIQIANGTYHSNIGSYRMCQINTKQELLEHLEALQNGTRKY